MFETIEPSVWSKLMHGILYTHSQGNNVANVYKRESSNRSLLNSALELGSLAVCFFCSAIFAPQQMRGDQVFVISHSDNRTVGGFVLLGGCQKFWHKSGISHQPQPIQCDPNLRRKTDVAALDKTEQQSNPSHHRIWL